ncbi:RIP metalloprotease RseP [Candidatus Falkowbacteria bacterium]|nr:RIP metalloprotease RseP [Candidatus Falkowbacteria bacterium]
MFLTIISFIIVLSLLVFVHELGHFISARKFGVKTEEFGFGLPPRIWGFYKSKSGKWKHVKGGQEADDAADTVYSLNWLPIGGFVKIKGEDGFEDGEKDNVNNKPVWQRMIIMSAGVFMNIVLAAVLFSIGFMFGLPQGVDDIDERAIVSEEKVQIVEVLPESPAEEAGLKMADAILSVNGIKIDSDTDLQDITHANIDQELSYEVMRGNEKMQLKITPRANEEGKGEIGIAIINTGLVRYPWYLAVWKGLKTSIIMVWLIIVAFYELIKGIFVGQGVPASISGPVGIAVLAGQFAEMGFVYLLQFTALLSINLAVINFLPFPALDGGRVIFLLIEKIKGSPIKREVEAVIHNTGFLLLLLLILVVTVRDVSKFTDKFIALWQKIF